MIIIVTPTFNRLPLLKRLYDSLVSQDDLLFTWVVIDDASEDETSKWLIETGNTAPFPIITLLNSQNLGKCLSLNRAFDACDAELYVVVDSDDYLLDNGVSTIRSKYAEVGTNDNIGALFFNYSDKEGKNLGGPPGNKDVVMARAKFDSIYGKYDGCVAYTALGINGIRYPEFAGETYIAPTVIQLLMQEPIELLFCAETVGVAEYQATGLTQSGRALRLENPLGMMLYSKLYAERGSTWTFRLKYRVSYWAYRNFIQKERLLIGTDSLEPPKSYFFERIAGYFINLRWRQKVRASKERQSNFGTTSA